MRDLHLILPVYLYLYLSNNLFLMLDFANSLCLGPVKLSLSSYIIQPMEISLTSMNVNAPGCSTESCTLCYLTYSCLPLPESADYV